MRCLPLLPNPYNHINHFWRVPNMWYSFFWGFSVIFFFSFGFCFSLCVAISILCIVFHPFFSLHDFWCAKQPHNQNASVKRTSWKCVHLPFSIQVRYCYYITFHYRFFFIVELLLWSGYYTFRAISIPYIKYIEHSLSSSSSTPPFLIITIIFAFMAKWFFAIRINTQSRFFCCCSSLTRFFRSSVWLLSLVAVVRCGVCGGA